jgi:alginate O-acetyltransferase complex protein AlgJ
MLNGFMNTALATLFMALICLPLVGGVLGWDLTEDLGEKRLPVRSPVLGRDPLEAIPGKFEAFYADRFGFRNGLIQGHNWIKYSLFKGSSLGKVLFGKDDWLFLTKSGIVTDFLGRHSLSTRELDTWKSVLEQRQQWLQERGIRYLFVIVPNKATVYPEMLPDHISRSRGRSRMDQLVDYLETHSSLDILDLREPLQQAKPSGLLYYSQDSHWTDRGAFIGYREICKKLKDWFPDIQPLRREDFDIAKTQGAGDLSMMLGLGEKLAEEREKWIPKRPVTPSNKQLTAPGGYTWTRGIVSEPQAVSENERQAYRLLLFNDSFAYYGGLQERLNAIFLRSAFSADEPDARCLEALIEQQHPDIVIHEVVERKLKDLPRFLPPSP